MQTNKVSKLYNYCPAVPRMLYEPHKVNKKNIVSTIIRLTETHRTLMVSGRDKVNPENNSQIGKTSTIKNKLIPVLEQNGLSVKYLDIRDLRTKWLLNSSLPYLEGQYKIFDKPKNITIIDEAHYIMPVTKALMKYEFNPSMPSVFAAGWNDLAVKFWAEVADLLQNNGKIIFVSCWHPLYNNYKYKEYNVTISLVINSPVIELKAEKR